MNEDNVYKGSFFTIDESQDLKDAREREQQANEATMPQIEKALELFRTNIEKFDRLPAIPDDVLNIEDGKAVALRNQIAINKGVVANLLPILAELEGLVAEYKR